MIYPRQESRHMVNLQRAEPLQDEEQLRILSRNMNTIQIFERDFQLNSQRASQVICNLQMIDVITHKTGRTVMDFGRN